MHSRHRICSEVISGSKYDLAGRVFSRVPAPYNLPVPPYHGQMYRDGIGESPDPKAAYAWLEVASLEGNMVAQREQMTALNRLDAADQHSAIGRAHTIFAQIDRNITPPGG
jgi:hypothetical protein